MAKVRLRPATPNGKPTSPHDSHKSVKRPRTVYMENSDEEQSPLKADKKTKGSPQKRVKGNDAAGGKYLAIQEQRKQLPIAQGTPSLL